MEDLHHPFLKAYPEAVSFDLAIILNVSFVPNHTEFGQIKKFRDVWGKSVFYQDNCRNHSVCKYL